MSLTGNSLYTTYMKYQCNITRYKVYYNISRNTICIILCDNLFKYIIVNRYLVFKKLS